MTEPPVFIGGVGGGGTRVLAAILRAFGYHIGEDLNDPLDNLWFTGLFVRRAIWSADDAAFARLYEAFRLASSGQGCCPVDRGEIEAAMLEPRGRWPPGWLRARAASLLARLDDLHPRPLWAWKEPNAHVVAGRVLALDPDARYVHLARNGLDMAFSPNQNQVRLWGDLVMPDAAPAAGPARSLRYWRWVEERAQRLRDLYPRRVFWIRFEDLCDEPEPTLARLAAFLGRPADTARGAASLVVPPSTIGRFRAFDRSGFRAADLGFVASLGFPVE